MSHINSLFFSCPEAAGVLKICSKLLCNFIEITLWHGCSPVNLLHILTHLFLRIPREGCFFMFLNKISRCKSIVKYELKTPASFFFFFLNYAFVTQGPGAAFHTFSGKYRSSRPEVFCEKGVLRNFAKFTEKHMYPAKKVFLWILRNF